MLGCGHLLPAGYGAYRAAMPRRDELCRHGCDFKGDLHGLRRGHVLDGGCNVVRRLHGGQHL